PDRDHAGDVRRGLEDGPGSAATPVPPRRLLHRSHGPSRGDRRDARLARLVGLAVSRMRQLDPETAHLSSTRAPPASRPIRRPARIVLLSYNEGNRAPTPGTTFRSPSMRYMRYASLLGVTAILAVGIYLWAADKKPAPDKQRQVANKAFNDGNFKDAYK